MTELPFWIQNIIGLILIGFIPMIVVTLIGTAKWFPKSLRSPLMIVGLLVVRGLNRTVPITEEAKDLSGAIFFISIIIFLAWAIKNKWRWDKEY